MKAILDDRQARHDPKHFMANGRVSANPEQPKRIEVLRDGALAAGCAFSEPKDHGAGPIAAIAFGPRIQPTTIAIIRPPNGNDRLLAK